MTLLITSQTWDRIRDFFSEEEKQQMRDVIVGQAICPAGSFVDEERLGAELRAKIEKLNKVKKGDIRR
jgi:hypothetical protein